MNFFTRISVHLLSAAAILSVAFAGKSLFMPDYSPEMNALITSAPS